MTHSNLIRFSLPLALLMVGTACSDDGSMGGTGGVGTGGVLGTGATGGTGTGGVGATGGTGTGGVGATGGTGTGGVGATGGTATGGVGATGGTATGGVGATGGTATGGVGATGGTATGGAGTGGAATGGTAGDGGTGGGTAALSFATDIEPILTTKCMPCHTTGAPGGLGMAQGMGYANLVGVASTEAPSLMRVTAGDSTMSYIINKLEGTQATVGGSGDQMPKGLTPLTTEIDTIKEWIDGGAMP